MSWILRNEIPFKKWDTITREDTWENFMPEYKTINHSCVSEGGIKIILQLKIWTELTSEDIQETEKWKGIPDPWSQRNASSIGWVATTKSLTHLKATKMKNISSYEGDIENGKTIQKWNIEQCLMSTNNKINK